MKYRAIFLDYISKKNFKNDIPCGRYECQAFNISEKQKGFENTRGTLFNAIVWIETEEYKNEDFIGEVIIELFNIAMDSKKQK